MLLGGGEGDEERDGVEERNEELGKEGRHPHDGEAEYGKDCVDAAPDFANAACAVMTTRNIDVAIRKDYRMKRQLVGRTSLEDF